jgi:hypothetical protein
VRSQLNRRILMLEARVPATRCHKKALPDWLAAEFVAQGARLKQNGTLDLQFVRTARVTDLNGYN